MKNRWIAWLLALLLPGFAAAQGNGLTIAQLHDCTPQRWRGSFLAGGRQ